jgi:hypothetical protein
MVGWIERLERREREAVIEKEQIGSSTATVSPLMHVKPGAEASFVAPVVR